MLTTAYYFLQVILCSAIVMGYYWIALRNKKFHQYNRFYLMVVALFSWTVPLIKIQWATTYANQQQVIRFLSVVADNNSEIEAVIGSKGFHWSMEGMVRLAYLLVAALLLALLLRAFYRIYDLLKTNSCKKVGDVFLIITQAKGTPFSFFRYIFWNEEIDIRSASGKQILQHELTHVQQQHSVDKLLIQVMLIPGWFNPFFWLLKKEMEMIHEFIADKKAVKDGDTAALAQMLLTAVYPKHHFELTHPFFFSPIKRRLQMLTNHKNPRFSYIRRLVILPLLAVVIVLFAFRNKEYRAEHPISVKNVLESVINDVKTSKQTGITVTDVDLETEAPMKLSKTYRIVINPGHGGEDVGARAADGTTESALTLQLAKMLKEKNNNPQLDIILTRNSDEFHTVVQVADQTNTLSPYLFVSIHVNSRTPVHKNGKITGYAQQKGAEIFLAEKTKTFDYNRSYLLANAIGNSMRQAGTTFNGIKSRNKGIYVLQAIKCPSVLVEAGFITNKEEAVLLKSQVYQEKIAMAILRGIESYVHQHEQVSNSSTGVEVKNQDNADFDGQFDLTKPRHNFIWPAQWFSQGGYSKLNYLTLLDGQEVDINTVREMPVSKLERINILKKASGVEKYGEKARNGVVEIFTKQPVSFKAQNDGQINKESGKPSSNINFAANTDESGSGIIQQQEPASFPGGDTAWRNYLVRNLNRDIPVTNGAPPGKYAVKVSFIVDRAGKLNDIKAENDPGYGTATEVVRMLSKGPNWTPAKVNGKEVVSRFEKTVTFMISEDDDESGQKNKVKDVKLDALYIKTDEPPYFPGGQAAWTAYLIRNLDADLIKKKGGPKGKYTVIIEFIVDENGRISNVKANNDPGYGTKEEAIRVIAKGPNWKPAVKKGKTVMAQHKITITFIHA
ncbi:MAG: N-acetylmuramoyl-L-alanine amidase [Bacteroidota bacterium]